MRIHQSKCFVQKYEIIKYIKIAVISNNLFSLMNITKSTLVNTCVLCIAKKDRFCYSKEQVIEIPDQIHVHSVSGTGSQSRLNNWSEEPVQWGNLIRPHFPWDCHCFCHTHPFQVPGGTKTSCPSGWTSRSIPSISLTWVEKGTWAMEHSHQHTFMFSLERIRF